MTNFDKLIMDIATDGTITAEEAFATAAGMLVDQFQALQIGFGSTVTIGDVTAEDAPEETKEEEKEEADETKEEEAPEEGEE